ncbi:MAG: hypothetical protein ACTH8J_08460 [Specibacter sp.]
MTTIVWAPGDLIVASNEGIDVRLAGVSLVRDVPEHLGATGGERGVRIGLEAPRNLETQRRDIAHLQEVEAWVAEQKLHGKGKAGPPPTMPGQAVLSAVKADITDNHDTVYRCVAGRWAGTGTEWDGSWTFLPEPPAGVKHLTIEFTVNGELTGKSCRVQLD